MRKSFLYLLLFAVASFGCVKANLQTNNAVPVSPTSANTPLKQNNNGKIESSELPSNTLGQERAVSQHLNCAASIKGLDKSVVIPERLCFDSKKRIDKTQTLPDRRAETDDPNIYDEQDVEYSKLPAEVREVIELTVGDVYKSKKLHLYVLRVGDEVTNKAVKSYRYVTENNDSVNRADEWTFNIQGGKMKLESADLHNSVK